MNTDKLKTFRVSHKRISMIFFGCALLICGLLLAFQNANLPFAFADLFSSKADSGQIAKLFNTIKNDTDLPSGSITKQLIPAAIRFILGLSSVFLTAVAIWAGILYVTQFGTAERVSKANKLLYWAVVGVVVSAFSYALVYGVLNLSFD